MKHLRKRKQRLISIWTKDFSCITAATVLSAIGGEAMNLPVSLFVFEKTQSTFLSALIMVCGMLPDIILPILAAPFIDKSGKKKWIVGLDLLLAVLYTGMSIWISGHTFQYGLYVGFTLLVGTISVFYRLAYSAWYPDLIPVGAEQKGYAISTTIYPFVTILISPVITFLYGLVSLETFFLGVSGMTIVSVVIESCICEKNKEAGKNKSYTLMQYLADIKEGFAYLKKEKGIRNIYSYMSITNGASYGVNIITQAYYQTQPWLTVTMLGFLKSAEMAGRVLGGFFQYTKEIPVNKRYMFTKFVYLFYDSMDALLLFLPYPLMLLNRFLCGGLGISSATIRETAVQSYLPAQIRARVNAFFDVMIAVGGVGFQLLAGILGMVMPFRIAAMLLGLATLGCVYVLIVLPAGVNRPVYEAVRKEKI
ncbi:MAG: MFS transporter [Lachnospiraceae bacterium]|nr:MFS transporter [Lachnospiraceae bacterium]